MRWIRALKKSNRLNLNFARTGGEVTHVRLPTNARRYNLRTQTMCKTDSTPDASRIKPSVNGQDRVKIDRKKIEVEFFLAGESLYQALSLFEAIRCLVIHGEDGQVDLISLCKLGSSQMADAAHRATEMSKEARDE
ncbi:hypothetical protein GIY62_14640 [Burkholderia plantarii]|uniref:hypothetical protein n=1 Tax=Burkholderia plantarii TaxID=41899 RepID=UPI00272A7D8F|nr:hypothetical protein [Burkholderia plantarii]WLE58364.1 hypothetical protein GIY62_14640 [Burkholderia plantarii]